ncbi:cytochrome P450 [Corynebacterium lizhenjunii]|uniref:Cytochrome P450 n=1 Tax=Corynebacterium lizhenjunii TaxID=2709394 RepID=A0A7T0KFR7_9CORY|nr:cytochrome P450 [Corynebacterium lizhenjunii]QPK78873.1 cytochrome P450 [Corynebacterium lizhenjunii]
MTDHERPREPQNEPEHECQREPQQDPREYAIALHQDKVGATLQGEDGERELVIVGHKEVVEAAQNPQVFSSAVSAHLQLPNGLDGQEHQRVRALVDSYLAPEVVAEFAGKFAAVADEVVADGELMQDPTRAADVFAVRAMLRWLSWLAALEAPLLDWMERSEQLAAVKDRELAAAVAQEYDQLVTQAVAAAPKGSVTHHLAHSHDLEHAEIVSILRNWTAGDLRSLAKCIIVIAQGLATRREVQERLREGASAEEFAAIANELLRMDDPFVSNRRITTCPVSIGGQDVPAGQRVRLHWTGANLDPSVFSGFDSQAHADANLVWGTGVHACPGKELSLRELEAFFTRLLRDYEIELQSGPSGRSARRSPTGGWETTPVHFARL